MAKTKELSFNCSTCISTANGRTITIEVDAPDMDQLLSEINDDDIAEYVAANLEPEQVYPESTLEKWAEANGYVKQDGNA